MTVGIISDIHGNSTALGMVLPELLDEVETVLFLGDLCGYYPFVNECAAMWDKDRIIGIRGNHDQVFLNCREQGTMPDDHYREQFGSALDRNLRTLSDTTCALIQSFPVTRTLELGGNIFALCHGAPWNTLGGRVYPDFDAWERFRDVKADVILMGHTHYPLGKKVEGKQIVNPGSVGQPRDKGSMASYAVMNLDTGEIQHRRRPFDPALMIEDATKYNPDLPYLTEVFLRQ